VVTRAQTAGE